MFPQTLNITVTSAAEEILVEQALALARDLQELAGAAPAGPILARCEEAAVAKGRDFTRQALEQTGAQRLQADPKKGRRCDVAAVANSATAKDPAKGRS